MQVLVPKDDALLGKMFEVVITSTGKHYLKGEVMAESLGRAPHRPTPLPQGAVSGGKDWKKKKKKNDEVTSAPSSITIASHHDSKPEPNSISTFSHFRVSDIVLVAIAALVLCAAVLSHYTQLFTVVWTR